MWSLVSQGRAGIPFFPASYHGQLFRRSSAPDGPLYYHGLHGCATPLVTSIAGHCAWLTGVPLPSGSQTSCSAGGGEALMALRMLKRLGRSESGRLAMADGLLRARDLLTTPYTSGMID